MTKTSSNKQRKRIFVDRHVQGGIVARLVFLWVASTILAVGVFFLMQYFADPTMGFAYYLGNAWHQLAPLVLAFAVTLPIAVLHLLRFTHRFAGPVVRLRRALRELADGDEVPRLKFRDNDYWQDLADEFNRAAVLLADTKRRVAELEAELKGTGDGQLQTDASELIEPVVAG